MGMSIDEIIAKETEIAQEFQKVVDTHIVNNDGNTIEEMCCDDTEVIEEHLQRCKVLADYHNQIVNTMRKYQKIKEILNSAGYIKNGTVYSYTYDEDSRVKHIREVFEDGPENNHHASNT